MSPIEIISIYLTVGIEKRLLPKCAGKICILVFPLVSGMTQADKANTPEIRVYCIVHLDYIFLYPKAGSPAPGTGNLLFGPPVP